MDMSPGAVALGGIGVSTDGGNVFSFHEWESFGIDHWCRYSSFLNSSFGFISGGKWPTSSSSISHRTLLNSFVDENENDADTDFILLPLSDSVSQRVPVTEENAELAAYYRSILAEKQENNDYQAVIAKTTDGGNSFQVVFESFGEFYLNQIFFINASVGLVVGENNRDGNGVIMRTDDGGATWSVVFNTENSMVALAMVDELEGWAGGAVYGAGISSYLVHTTDGGRTWQEWTQEENIQFGIWNIAGVDASSVYAVAFNQAASSLLRYSK